MSALFNFNSLVVVVLLTICTCTYIKGKGEPAKLVIYAVVGLCCRAGLS